MQSSVPVLCVWKFVFYKYMSFHSNFSIAQEYLPDAHMFPNLLTMLSPICVVKHTLGKKYMVIKDQKDGNSKVPTTLFKIKNIWEDALPPFFNRFESWIRHVLAMYATLDRLQTLIGPQSLHWNGSDSHIESMKLLRGLNDFFIFAIYICFIEWCVASTY